MASDRAPEVPSNAASSAQPNAQSCGLLRAVRDECLDVAVRVCHAKDLLACEASLQEMVDAVTPLARTLIGSDDDVCVTLFRLHSLSERNRPDRAIVTPLYPIYRDGEAPSLHAVSFHVDGAPRTVRIPDVIAGWMTEFYATRWAAPEALFVGNTLARFQQLKALHEGSHSGASRASAAMLDDIVTRKVGAVLVLPLFLPWRDAQTPQRLVGNVLITARGSSKHAGTLPPYMTGEDRGELETVLAAIAEVVELVSEREARLGGR